MYYISFGKLKPLKAKVFADWFNNEENVKNLKESLPDGAKFIGAFFVGLGHAKHDFEIVYEIDNYAVIDNWTNANPKVKKFGEEFAKTIGIIAEWVNSKVLKAVGEVELLDPKIFKKD